MNHIWRAIYGAAFGALGVLLLHPQSRPFLLTSVLHWGESRTFRQSPLIVGNRPVLPTPATTLDAGTWMQTGATKLALQAGSKAGTDAHISRKNFEQLISVARWAAKQEPDNAYWPQMEAVFLYNESKLPDTTEKERQELWRLAIDRWDQASNLRTWDDRQKDRLAGLQQELAKETGGSAAWQYEAVAGLRNADPAYEIQSLAIQILREFQGTSKEALIQRYATLINGARLREGSRSVGIGQIGASLVELASSPKDVGEKYITPRRQRDNRRNFYLALLHSGLAEDAKGIPAAFDANDGWIALTHREDATAEADQLRLVSILTVSVPGALLFIALLGAAIWGFAALLKLKPNFVRLVEPPIAPALGVVLAVLLYGETRLMFVSLAIVACFSFLAFTPIHRRTRPPKQLGPVYELTLFALSILIGLLGTAFVVGVCTPGYDILSQSSLPTDLYGGSTLLLGLCAVVLGLLFFAAPCWAMLQRISTPEVVVLSLRQFGRGLFTGCVLLTVIATPILMIIDRVVTSDVKLITLNEPSYYLQQSP